MKNLDKLTYIYRKKQKEHEYFLLRALLIIFTFSFTNSSILSCNSVYPTLSNVNLCTGNICSYKEVLTDTISLQEGNTACFDLTSVDNTLPNINITVHVDMAFLSVPTDYHYHTGYFDTDFKFFCSCPGGSSSSCTDCSVSPKYPDNAVCIDGFHTDKSCLLDRVGSHGDYCGYVSFSNTTDNIVVAHVSPVGEYTAQITVMVDNTMHVLQYEGRDVTYEFDKYNITVTLSELVVDEEHNFEFVVFDRNHPFDFFLFGSDLVNSIFTCDPKKFGWQKYNHTFCDDTLDMRVMPKECTDDKFTYHYSWVDQSTFLFNNRQFHKGVVAPGSLFIDGEFDFPFIINSTLPISDTGYYGFLAISDFEVYHIGWNNYLPAGANLSLYTGSLPTILNVSTPGPWVCTNVIVKNTLQQDRFFFICSHQGANGPSHYRAFCRTNAINYQTVLNTGSFESINCVGIDPATCHCLNITDEFYIYPDRSRRTFTWSWGKDFALSGRNTESLQTSRLQVPLNKGALEFVITLPNYNVSYDNTNIQPVIKDVTFDITTKTVTITARSNTFPGSCLLIIPELFQSSKTIILSTNFAEYNYDTVTDFTNGTLTMRIECGKFRAQKNVSVTIDNIVQPLPITEVETGGDTDYSPWSWSDFAGLNWSDKLYKILILVGAIGGTLLIAVVITKFMLLPVTKGIYTRMFQKFPISSKNAVETKMDIKSVEIEKLNKELLEKLKARK